jgi:hypothetical protein
MAGADDSAADAPPEEPRSRRLLLAIAAALELWSAVGDLPVLAGDLSKIPGPGLGGAIVVAKIALQPLLALAALIFAASGRIRPALLAFAAMIFLTWLSFLPSVAIHGLDLAGSPYANALLLFQIVLAPLIAMAVAGLALLRERLGLAVILAILPTLVAVFGTIAFAVGVALYGF